MSNRVDPDETTHYEPSHLNLCCLQKPINIAYGSKRVNADNVNFNQKLHSAASDLSLHCLPVTLLEVS